MYTQPNSPFEKKKRKKKGEPRKTTKGKGRNFRTTKEGAGMTEKGVKEYRRKNPGSKLKTAVTKKTGLTKKDQKVGKVKEVEQQEEDGGVKWDSKLNLHIKLIIHLYTLLKKKMVY